MLHGVSHRGRPRWLWATHAAAPSPLNLYEFVEAPNISEGMEGARLAKGKVLSQNNTQVHLFYILL